MSRPKISLFFSVFASCGVLFGACRYQVVANTEYPERSFFLQIRNDSLVPQMSGILRRSILEELLTKSVLQLAAKKEDADMLAVITLVNYANAPEVFEKRYSHFFDIDFIKVFEKSDSLAAAGFGMEVEARLELSRDGKESFSRIFTGSASVLKEDRLTLPHARQANMAMAQDLARQISFGIINYSK